jgi:hypothetical protein
MANGSIHFKFNETDQPVNSSLCYISSLEVYRGRQLAIEISHQGFSLRDNGSIEVCRFIQLMGLHTNNLRVIIIDYYR